MSAISKLEFVSKYGTDKHKAGIQAKVDHLVKNLPEDEYGREDVAKSGLVSGHALTKMVNHEDYTVSHAAAENPNLEPHHIEHIINHGESHQVRNLASAFNPNKSKITAEHIHRILDKPPALQHPAEMIGYRKDLDDSHYAKIVNHHSHLVTLNAMRDMPTKHLKHVAEHHKDWHVNDAAQIQLRYNRDRGIT
jgi:hypothetical protein